MFNRILAYPVLLLCALFIMPASALAVSTVSISPAGKGVFVIRGVGMQNVAGLELNIGYDSTTLSNPRVASGSLINGMLNATNTGGNPIKMAIVGTKAIGGSGSGTIATITFAGAGKITDIYGNLIDPGGKKVAVSFSLSNPEPVTSTEDLIGTPDSKNTGDVAGYNDNDGNKTTQPFVVGGTLTFPSDDTAGKDAKEPALQTAQQEKPEQQVARPETAAPANEAGEGVHAEESKLEEQMAEAPKAAEPAPVPQRVQSVLERFRLFQGERTVNSLTGLFSSQGAASFSQSPAIGIADGKASVMLKISKVPGSKSPNFAFNSARYVSLTGLGNGQWEVEARPEKDAVKASITMLANDAFQELPLTVAPKAEVVLNKSGQLTEADFLLFLQERGTASAPKFDMNGDGKRDYVDDYIFTANYLVKMEEKANKKTTTEQKPQ